MVLPSFNWLTASAVVLGLGRAVEPIDAIALSIQAVKERNRRDTGLRRPTQLSLRFILHCTLWQARAKPPYRADPLHCIACPRWLAAGPPTLNSASKLYAPRLFPGTSFNVQGVLGLLCPGKGQLHFLLVAKLVGSQTSLKSCSVKNQSASCPDLVQGTGLSPKVQVPWCPGPPPAALPEVRRLSSRLGALCLLACCWIGTDFGNCKIRNLTDHPSYPLPRPFHGYLASLSTVGLSTNPRTGSVGFTCG